MEEDLTSKNILNVDDFSENVSKALESASSSADDAARLLDRITSLGKLKCILGEKIILLINQILQPHGNDLKLKTEYENTDDLCNAFDDIVDELGRRIDNHLQEAQGKQVVNGDSMTVKTRENQETKKDRFEQSFTNSSINIRKPQASFKIPVDNSFAPFVPLIFEKPNALKSLEESLRKDKTEGELFGRPHPYQFELDNFVPGEDLLTKVVPKHPNGLKKTPLIYVDTEEHLEEVVSKLKECKEIAVDLEHHSMRSYLGFTCLMQLSTRDEDFIVDTIALRHVMHKFNVIFTDPKIVKVFHGSDSDVVWLQKDFGVYLVNTFDTGLASRSLQFPSFSYAYVLEHYCDVKADKQHQLADWRRRPLPEELLKYARSDTHYLLYIYDRMRNDLINENNGFHGLLSTVIQNSTNLCKKRYEKPNLKENSHLSLLKDSGSHLNPRQMEVLKKLFEWRDGLAREQDESTGFLLSNQMLLNLVNNMPKDIGGVLACLDKSKVAAAESIYRILSSIHGLPDSYFEGPKEEPKPLIVMETNKEETLYEGRQVVLDTNGVNKADYMEEDLILKALKNVSVNDEMRKPLSAKNLTPQSRRSKKFNDILNSMLNPIVMFWPDSFLAATDSIDDINITFTMKPHTFSKLNKALPERPEVIATQPIMLLDESKNKVDKLLKSVRTQIHEEEGPKRKAEEEEGSSEGASKKKKIKMTENPEIINFEPHQYNDEEFNDIMRDEPVKKGHHKGSRKRKANDLEPEPKKRQKVPNASRAVKSLSFMPKDNKPQPGNRPSSSNAPRIPWPSKK